VGWGQLTGKLMPRLYSPSVVGFFEKLWAAGGARHLRDLVSHGYYGVLPPGDSYADDLPIRFIRSAEMNGDLDVDLDDCPFVEEQYYIKKAQVQKDDVLLAVKGATIASRKCVAHVREDVGHAIVNGSIYRMQVKPEVNPRFLAIVLSTEMLKRQMRLALTANNGVDYLDKSLIHHLVVPAPERTMQDKLVATYDAAMAASISAKAEAAALLASIDDYLLSELGIVLPPETENTLANRTFRVSAHELGGWRFDPYHHQTCFHKFDDALQGGKHPLSSLRNAYRALVNGYDCRDFVEDGLPYLKVAQVKPFNLKIEDAQAIPVSGVPARGLALMGDLLLTRKGTYGDAALNRSDTPFAFSSEVFRIRLNPSKLNGDYAEAVLNSVLVRTQFKRHSIGAIMGSLSQSIFGKIQIPLPPIDEQQRIAEYCQIIRGHAKVLEAKATAELETAKREIEAILLDSP
jgi:restriction endonuclease S subunit